MRLLIALILSAVISVAIFFAMNLMTTSKNSKLQEKSETRHLVYLREKNETKIERKKRVKPKEPLKKKPPKKIEIKTKVNTQINKNIKVKAFKVQSKQVDISALSSLSGAQIEMNAGLVDANSLTAISKVNPRFPRRAKIRKQSGYVKLSFLINKHGNVSNVKILESKPKGVFDKNSIYAIKKWKFERNEFDRNATITFNFRLQR
ncbi:energy transducer TonB [Arcobacter roscoffensis]|uniref:Energy transducer TonB n=1 Tax=Arcobacter roscoffensis TaxID=2961520 RepID=A0ABY5E880_9BACT|nr:energy transducer TonB [Arcobacter roscoffensis]UTJ06935.1 energy transducer TonB [Arcobacter roscoffensis]